MNPLAQEAAPDGSTAFLSRRNLLPLQRYILFLSMLFLAVLAPRFAKAATYTIGSGTSSDYRFPIYAYYPFSYSQSLYLSSDMVSAGATAGAPGIISSISYNITSLPSDFSLSKDWVIYMGNTSKSSYASSSDWVSAGTMTKVFDGKVIPTSTGWYTITLTTPFYWDGVSNIAVGVDENTDGTVYEDGYFATTTIRRGKTRSICVYDYSTNPDPFSPAGSYSSTLTGTPDVEFDFTPALPCSGTVAGGSAITPATTLCLGAPALLSVSGATLATGMTFEWESSPTGLAGSWTVISGATADIYSATPPEGVTTYYRRKTTCTYTSLSDYSTPVAVSVGTGITPPYTEDFESGTAGINIPCASNTGSWNSSNWYLNNSSYCSVDNHTFGGTNYLFAGNSLEVSTGNQEFWFTPALNLTAGKTYRFSYWYMTDGYLYNTPGTGAYLGTAQTRAAMTPIGPYINTTNSTYDQYVTDFTVPSTGTYYAGIRVRSTYNCGMGIDDLNLVELPDCNTATALGSAGKAAASPNVICSVPGSTVLSLSKTPAYSGLDFSWEIASGTPSSFSDAGITTASGSYSFSTNGNYYFRCKVTCTATGLTAYSDTVKVMTTPITPPYIEDFESAPVPDNLPCAGYTGSWGSPGSYWTTAAAGSPGPSVENHTTGGSKLLLAGGQLGIGTGGNAYWYTPGLSLIAGKAYDISFWYKSASAGSWVDAINYQLGIAYGSSQSSSDMTAVDDTTLPHSDMKLWRQFRRGFVATTTGVQYIGILASSSDYVSYGVNIDDIGVEQLPPCSAQPVAGKAISSPSMLCSPGDRVFIALKGTSAASDLSFQWQRSITGLPGTWSNVTGGSGGTTPGYKTPILSASVYYRCVVICGLIATPNADTSTPVRVQVGPIIPPYIEDFETATAGVNQPCAKISYEDYGFWETSTLTSNYNGWSIKNKPGSISGYNTNVKNHTIGGKYYLSAGQSIGESYFGSGSSDADQQYWFSPPLQLTAGGMAYRCNYWYVNNGYPYTSPAATYGLYYGTSQDPSAMTPIRSDVPLETNTAYKEIAGTLRPTSDGVYYLGVKFKNTTWASNYGHAIDDIGVTQLPLCTGVPAAGVINANPARICAAGGTTMLSLKGTTEASMISFRWLESTAGASGPWDDVAGGSGAASDVYTTDGLSASRWYRCVVSCSVIGAPNTDTTAPFEIGVGALDVPYVEDFETTVPGNNVLCAAFSERWGSPSDYSYTTVRGTPVSAYTTINQHTPGGKNMLWLGYTLAYTGDQYWWTPGINLIADSTYEFSYWYNGPAYPYGGTAPTLGMYYGTEQSFGAMTPIGPDVLNVNVSSYKQMIGRIVSPGTGVYYFGIKVNMPSWMDPGIGIDDIGINQLPLCTGVPTAGTVSVAPAMLCSAGGSADLNMDLAGVSKVAGLGYTWYSSTTGPTGPWTDVSGSLSSPLFTTPGLPSTSWFYCEVKCSNTGDFINSSVLKVDVGVIIPPYIETFESNTDGYNMPCAGYTGYWGGPDYAWSINNSPLSGSPTADNHTRGGSKYLMAGYGLGYMWGYPGAQYWFTPAIRFTGGKLYQFSFWYNGPGTSDPTLTTTIGAYYGTDQSPAGMTTSFGPDLSVNQFVYKLYKQQFTPAATGDYYIGIKAESISGVYPGVSIDDIGLQEVPPCDAPVVAGTIVPDPVHICSPGASATLDLEGVTLATGLMHQWLSASSPAGPYTLMTGTGLPYSTDPLNSNTWFRAIVTCTATGAADTSDAIEIGVGGMSIPYSEDFEELSAGQRPVCSDATYWGLYDEDGYKVKSDPPYSSAYNNTPGGSKYMAVGYSLGCDDWYSPVTDDNYWFTPGLALDSRYKYEFSYYYVGASNTIQRVSCFYGTSQSAGAMTNVLQLPTMLTGSYEHFDTTFQPARSAIYYIGFRKTNIDMDYVYNNVGLDDINLNYAPCDGMPFAGNISSTVPSGTPTCLNTGITLTDIGATINLVPGIKYQWMRRPVASGTAWSSVVGATDSVLTADTLIGYEYKFGVICGNTGDTAFSSTFQLPANPVHPAVMISPSASPASYCLGDSVKFNATAYTDGVYDWMIDSVVQYGWKFSDMGATEPGEYMVRVVSPLSPCPAYSNKVKLVINDPGYSIEITKPGDSIICDGGSMLLTAVASKSGVSIQWRKDNVDMPFKTGSSYLVTSSGYYRAVGSDGVSLCPAVTRNIHIVVKPSPPAIIRVPGGTTTACENDGVVLKANAGYSYEWMRSDAPMVGSVDDSLVVKNSGVYSVKVRTSDGCTNVSSEITVNILPSPKPVITKTNLGGGSVELNTTTFLNYQWYRNGVKISGGSDQKLSLFKNGTYTVKVIGTNGCEGTSDPIEIDEDGLSIENTGVHSDEIRIYPNPTQSKVFIESPVTVRVSVKDITGKTVLQPQEVKEVDLSKYADGIYLFTISDKEGNELIKQQRVTKFTK